MSAAEEDGFTLPELLVAASMMLIVLAAIGPSLIATIHLGGNQSERITDLDQDRVAFDQIARDLRQASCVTQTTAGRAVTVTAPVAATGACAGGTQMLKIDCGVPSDTPGLYKCVRSDLIEHRSKTLVDGIDNTDPLTLSTVAGAGRTLSAAGSPPSSTVQIKLEIPDEHSATGRDVRLSGSVTLRTAGLV